MKSLLIVAATVLLIATKLDSMQPANLTVHEWGTFTSVAGEDGSAVDWDALGCNDLPTFVNDHGFRNLKWRLRGTVRMETPVMYFYSPGEVEAHVKVTFPQGLITEWYPTAEHEVYQASRLSGSLSRLSANLNGIDTSLRSVTGTIEWKNVKVQPNTAPALLVEHDRNRYYAARETDAAPIGVAGQHEKFLFYRGVGRFPVPLSARIADDGKIVVENRGRAGVPRVFLFENYHGSHGYRDAGAVQESVTLDPPALDGSPLQLPSDLEAALVSQGLFLREARAMVETWRDSWFEEGSRLVYILPSPAVDAILPLQVEPTPSQTVRVFVGRIELVTPGTMHSVEEAIARNEWGTIDRYGRFLDPILTRISSNGPSSRLSSLSPLSNDRIEQFRRTVKASIGTEDCR